jgi:hypothetical protein
MKICKVDGCERESKPQMEYCNLHYNRLWRSGSTELLFPERKLPPIEKIKRNVEENENGCWVLTRYTDEKGYGRLRVNGKLMKAHRIMYEYATGEKLTKDDAIMHTCDNPSCCNPRHLEKGTRAENNRDRAKKKRSATGEKSGKSKLSKEDVIKIRELYYSDEFTRIQLAEMFGVSKSQIDVIVTRKQWRDID